MIEYLVVAAIVLCAVLAVGRSIFKSISGRSADCASCGTRRPGDGLPDCLKDIAGCTKPAGSNQAEELDG